jgi:hypothetical protein
MHSHFKNTFEGVHGVVKRSRGLLFFSFCIAFL